MVGKILDHENFIHRLTQTGRVNSGYQGQQSYFRGRDFTNRKNNYENNQRKPNRTVTILSSRLEQENQEGSQAGPLENS